MRTIHFWFIATVLFAPLLSWGQFSVEQPMFQVTASVPIENPSQIADTLYRWWLSSDASGGVTLSNQISDRVVGDPMWQMNTSLSPTNSASGIYFGGTKYLTNSSSGGIVVGSITGSGRPDVFFFVFVPSGVAGEQQMFSFGSPNERGPGMSGTNLRYTGTASGGPNTICAIAANTTNDVVMVMTDTNITWYTNGVLVRTNTAGVVDVFPYKAMGRGGLGYYTGYIMENGIYTNDFFSATEVSKLHKYFTNTYKYSP